MNSQSTANFLLVSCSNTGNLAALLNKDSAEPRIHATEAPFGQVIQTLLLSDQEVWTPATTGAIVWTLPDSISATFRRLCAGEEVDPAELLTEVDFFCAALKKIPSSVKTIFVPLWALGP